MRFVPVYPALEALLYPFKQTTTSNAKTLWFYQRGLQYASSCMPACGLRLTSGVWGDDGVYAARPSARYAPMGP